MDEIALSHCPSHPIGRLPNMRHDSAYQHTACERSGTQWCKEMWRWPVEPGVVAGETTRGR